MHVQITKIGVAQGVSASGLAAQCFRCNLEGDGPKAWGHLRLAGLICAAGGQATNETHDAN